MQEFSKVIEPANLQSFLGGKIIEYGTGLTESESKILVQMAQIDHILIFEETTTPYTEYRLGGRANSSIKLKIVNTLKGEIIFQTNSDFGLFYPDPRPYGHTHVVELGQNLFDLFRTKNLTNIYFQLIYAVGDAALGFLPSAMQGSFTVGEIMIGSPAEKAGIQKDDKIMEINGVPITNVGDIISKRTEINLKQGTTSKVKIDRKGNFLDIDVALPIIPKEPESQPEIKEKPQKKLGTPL